jgi:hypothetical protein
VRKSLLSYQKDAEVCGVKSLLVRNMTEQFSRLMTIRKDTAGLFDKLSGAVNGGNGAAR